MYYIKLRPQTFVIMRYRLLCSSIHNFSFDIEKDLSDFLKFQVVIVSRGDPNSSLSVRAVTARCMPGTVTKQDLAGLAPKYLLFWCHNHHHISKVYCEEPWATDVNGLCPEIHGHLLCKIFSNLLRLIEIEILNTMQSSKYH